MSFKVTKKSFVGSHGSLMIAPGDEVSLKLAMLIEGECGEKSPIKIVQKYGFSRQRYFQLRAAFREKGALGLVSRKRGPKSNYRRTGELLCQVIRHRFLDPDASSEVITQKLRQCGFVISKRTVDRVFSEFGLQKKTLQVSPRPGAHRGRNIPNQKRGACRISGSAQFGTRCPADIS